MRVGSLLLLGRSLSEQQTGLGRQIEARTVMAKFFVVVCRNAMRTQHFPMSRPPVHAHVTPLPSNTCVRISLMHPVPHACAAELQKSAGWREAHAHAWWS